MKPARIRQFFKHTQVGGYFTFITVMFVSVLLGILFFTIYTIQHQKSNAVLLDMAGRQRMLFQQHLNAVFLASQGYPADISLIREHLDVTLKALSEGGPVMFNLRTGHRQTIPEAPTDAITEALRDQHDHFKQFKAEADQFLELAPDHPEYAPRLQTLHAANADLVSIADQTVKLLKAYDESNLETMLRWETIIAVFVGLLGVVVTVRGVRDGRILENEILERKRAEAGLRTSEWFLNSMIENLPHMIFVKSAMDFRFVRFNKAGEALLDCSRDELLGKTDQDIFPKEQADFFAEKDQEVITGKGLVDIIGEPIQTKSKGLRYLHTKKIPLCDDQGHPQYILGISEDITEHLHRQESLRRSEERYRVLYEDNPSMYFTVARDGTILSVNQFGARQLGYTVEELVGLPVVNVFYEEDQSLVIQHFTECLEHPRTLFRWELRKQRKDGSRLYVREVARAIQEHNGETVVLIVCEDITEWKTTEERLRDSEVKRLQALRQSDELKSALLASVSHELRTPLTAMKASVSNVLEQLPSGLNENHRDLLMGVDREIFHMSRLVENLLDMSRIEAGTLTPRWEWHPVEDLLEGALRRMEQVCESRRIEVQIPEDLPPVCVDAVEMQQVLINLLDNALKYSWPDSTIRINVEEGVEEIRITFSNQGEALQAQALERIFERFYRHPSSREQPVRGTGLGLAISKAIVEAHGGRIWAEAEEQTVSITLMIPVTESMATFSLEGLNRPSDQP